MTTPDYYDREVQTPPDTINYGNAYKKVDASKFMTPYVPQFAPIQARNNADGIAQGLINFANVLSQSRAHRQQQEFLTAVMQKQAQEAQQADITLAQVLESQGFDPSIRHLPKELQGKVIDDELAQRGLSRRAVALMQLYPGMFTADQAKAYAMKLEGVPGMTDLVKGGADRYNKVQTLEQVIGYKPDLNSPQGRALFQIITGQNAPETTATLGSQVQALRKDTVGANVAEATQQYQIDEAALKPLAAQMGIEYQTLTNDEKRALMPYVIEGKQNEVTAGSLANNEKAFDFTNKQAAFNRMHQLVNDPEFLKNPGMFSAELAKLNMQLGGENPLGEMQQSQEKFIGGDPNKRKPESFTNFNNQYPSGGFTPPPVISNQSQGIPLIKMIPTTNNALYNFSQQTPEQQRQAGIDFRNQLGQSASSQFNNAGRSYLDTYNQLRETEHGVYNFMGIPNPRPMLDMVNPLHWLMPKQ